jgi:hypothetical protein
MFYAVEMGSDAMVYTSTIMKISSRVQKLLGRGYT